MSTTVTNFGNACLKKRQKEDCFRRIRRKVASEKKKLVAVCIVHIKHKANFYFILKLKAKQQ